MLNLEQARDNIQGVLDQLRLTRPERDVLDTSLRVLYNGAAEVDELEKELENANKPQAA